MTHKLGNRYFVKYLILTIQFSQTSSKVLLIAKIFLWTSQERLFSNRRSWRSSARTLWRNAWNCSLRSAKTRNNSRNFTSISERTWSWESTRIRKTGRNCQGSSDTTLLKQVCRCYLLICLIKVIDLKLSFRPVIYLVLNLSFFFSSGSSNNLMLSLYML